MSLSEAAVYVKKFLKYFWVALGGIVIIWLVVMGGINFIPNLFNGGVRADYAFGIIPKPTIPQNVSSKGLSFVLDTVDGKYPNIPGILPVYQTSAVTADLLGSFRAGQLADSFGFPSSPNVLDSQTYQFTINDQQFTVNIATQNFVLSSNNSKGIYNGPAPSDAEQDLIDQARSVLKTHQLLPDELANSQATVTYRKITPDGSVLADSIDSGNFARVDIFRNNVGDYQIVGPFRDQALIYIGLKGGTRSVTDVHFTYWPYQTDKKGLYTLLSVDSAFKALQDGQASLISPATANFKQVRINKISIAYYQDDNYQPYLEPIYLFDGVGSAPDGSEVQARFYLPAVDPHYLK